MVVSQPVFVADRCRIAKFLIQKLLEVDLVRALQDSLPEFQDFLYMLMDLITSCAAIVDNTFFKKRAAHGKCLSSKFRCNDSTLPVEINIRKIDPGNAFILIGGKNSFIKYRDKSFKLRPELADLFCQVLKNIYSPGSSNSKDDNITKFCPTFSVKISHITETMDQCFTTCDDVTDHQSTVRNHGQFAVLDLKPCHLIFRKNTLAGKKADIMNTDMLFITGLLKRIIQRPS